MFPHIVPEVACSQTYEDLVTDAREWLVTMEGDIKRVVLFLIEEGDFDAEDKLDSKSMKGVLGRRGRYI